MTRYYIWLTKKFTLGAFQKTSLLFFEQLHTFHQMGFSILQSIMLLQSATKPILPKDILKMIQTEIEQGYSLPECLESLKAYFCPMTQTFLKIAQQSHDFFSFMNIWVKHEKIRADLIQRIKSQCAYPLFLSGFWLLFFFFFSQKTLPEYQNLAQQLGTTKIQNSWYLSKLSYEWLGIPFIILFYFRKPIINRWAFKQNLDWWVWSSFMDMGRKMGLSDLQSLEIIAHHFKNFHQLDWIEQTIQQLRWGANLEACFEKTPPVIQQYLIFFHHHQVFEHLTQYFEKSLQQYLKRLERYLQPILLFFIAALAAITLWMMYQPLFEIMSNI